MKYLKQIEKMESILDYKFIDKGLLLSAITHPSAVEGLPVSASYERLEFLGDSVVGALVAAELFRKFPDMDEGDLTRLKVSLVSGESFTSVAAELGFADCIIFGESEKGTGARGLRSALENVYESVIGALYLDAGMDVTAAWVHLTLGPHLDANKAVLPESPKSSLQEVLQRDYKETPYYSEERMDGPAHDPMFTCNAFKGDEIIGTGRGTSKKKAEKEAALDALHKLGYIRDSKED